MKPILGTVAGGGPLVIDLQRLVDTRLLVQANSGGGKSWALRRLLEQTHGQVQHLVIDPEGEFASLRERYDYLLAARAGGDTVADPRSAKLLAERLLELGVSAVLDIYELKADERVRFVRGFLEALVDAPKKLWHPALVVVDETHVYCPEKGSAESAGAVIDLATRGRKRGYCAVFATQRLSKLNKDAAAECNNKLIGRTGLDVDMDRAAGELGFGKSRVLELRELPEGHFFAFGPALSRAVVPVHVGPVLTTHPKAGARLAFTPPPPSEKVRELLPKLADLPAEAEQRERTVADLKREIASLKGQLRSRPTVEVPKAETKRVEVPVLKDTHVKRLETAVERLLTEMARTADQLAQRQQVVVTEAGNLRAEIKAALAASRDNPREGAAGRILAADGRPRAAAPHTTAQKIPEGIMAGGGGSAAALRSAGASRPTPVVHGPPAEGLSRPQQKILDSLAWLASIGVEKPSRRQVALVSEVSAVSSGYEKNISTLKTAELVRYPGDGLLGLTDAGRAIARVPAEAPTIKQLQETVLSRVSRPQAVLLRVLIEKYPEALSREDLAAAADVSAVSSGYEKNVSTLRSLGLVDYPSQGTVAAEPVLFLEGA